MNTWQIILAPVVFLAGCQPWWSQQMAPAAPAVPYPTTPAPSFVGGPPYLTDGAMFQAPPQGVPMYPPGSTVVPLPSQTPGSIFGPPMGPPSPTPMLGIPPGVVVAPQPVAPPGPAIAAAPG